MAEKTREELKAELQAQGYEFIRFEICKGKRCGQKYELWRFKDRDAGRPVRVMDSIGIFQSHFITCVDRDQFGSAKKPTKQRAPVKDYRQNNLFG